MIYSFLCPVNVSPEQDQAAASRGAGIVLLATALGVSISPEIGEAVVSAGLAAAGLIAVATRG